jgi:Domain of unknown function (DUF4190)
MRSNHTGFDHDNAVRPFRRAIDAQAPEHHTIAAAGFGGVRSPARLTAIPAIVLGHAARRQMRRTGERGGSMALTGLILGWVGIGLIIAIVVGLIAAASAAGHNVDSVAHPISGG